MTPSLSNIQERIYVILMQASRLQHGVNSIRSVFLFFILFTPSFFLSASGPDNILFEATEKKYGSGSIHLPMISTGSLQPVLVNPVITTRFANPEYNCTTFEYCVDVEFQSDIVDQEIFGMNVRFFYDDQILELIDLRDFQGGYGLFNGTPPVVASSPPGIGYNLFGFGAPGTGIADFVNGAIQLNDENQPPIYVSTTGWTKIFQVCFNIDDPNPNVNNFCPSLVWDLEQNPANGGFLAGDDGVVITVVDEVNGGTIPAFEEVEQFNWIYVGTGAPPYGQPAETNCISLTCGPIITCPGNITVDCGESILPANTGSATAVDNCPGEPVITYSDVTTSGSCGVQSTIMRTWTATDGCSNSTTCQQIITLDRKGIICGTVFNDLGQPMSGIEFKLLADINTNQTVDLGDILMATVFSNAAGQYCFSQVEPCAYVIEEVQPVNHGDVSDFDSTPDPDGDDSADGPDNEIPVVLIGCEPDSNNNFVDIVCPSVLPSIPSDTICENGTTEFQITGLNLGSLTYAWGFGSGSNPATGVGLGPHTISYITTTENQNNGASIDLTISKAGCPDLFGPVGQVEINPFPDASINTATTPVCYYTNKTFQPSQPFQPVFTYQWNFGSAAVPSSATGYGPHTVYYTASGIKTAKLVIHPNQAGAQCPDSSTVMFLVNTCSAQILGYVLSETNQPIVGVNLRLYKDNNTDGVADNDTIIRTVYTTAIGSYSMATLTPGHYVIQEIQPNGWISVNDEDNSNDGDVVPNLDPLDNLIPASLYPSEVDSMNNFKESASDGTILGAVFEDFNSNDMPDGGEGISGVLISLFADTNTDGHADSGTPLVTQLTNSSGSFSLTGIDIGHYVLTETQPSGYTSIEDFDSSDDLDVVPNTNIHNDTIPVTIINSELDEHNYFIDSEDCSHVVTNVLDSGAGSLRDAIECAMSGDTITFHSSLSGATIIINSQIIVIDKNIHILSSFEPRITITSQIAGLFDIAENFEAEFKSLNIVSGLAGNNGAAFNNVGTLKLNDINIYKNPLLPPGEYLIRNYPTSELFLNGSCFLEMN